MGLSDLLADLYAAVSLTDLHAEAPPPKDDEQAPDTAQDDDNQEKNKDSEESNADEKDESSDETGEEEAAGDHGEAESEPEPEEKEEEEEEEDEPVDPMPQLEAECARSAACAPLKHHYEDCVERVTRASEDTEHKGPKEDCVEEFFHLQHCATQCAAPKLFKLLK